MQYLDEHYLGDGVYAAHDGYQIRLTTEDGGEFPSNEIFLEPGVFQLLVNYANGTACRTAPAGNEEEAR